jgi:hypothetical protein
MVACISPSELDIQETLTTLQYASRARAVQNKVAPSLLVPPLFPTFTPCCCGQIKANISTAHLEMDTNLIDTLREQLATVQAQLKEQQQLTSLLVTERKDREGTRGAESPGASSPSGSGMAEVISEQKRGIILERLSGIQRVLQVLLLPFIPHPPFSPVTLLALLVPLPSCPSFLPTFWWSVFYGSECGKVFRSWSGPWGDTN